MDRSVTDEVMSGPLAGLEVALRAELARLGYAPSTAKQVVATMGRLSAWMQREDIAPGQLNPVVLDALPRHLTGTRPVVRFLRGCGAIPPASCVDGAPPVEVLVGEFARWLTVERALSPVTVRCYSDRARRFLTQIGDPLNDVLWSLDAKQVTVFMVDYCARVGCAEAKLMVTALRSLLLFLHVTGRVPRRLADAVAGVARWQQASLPRGLDTAQVSQLLEHGCDRATATGRRDYAMLMLLAQLGLRIGEVASLGLRDLDWAAGEVVIHGKAARIDRLPLPVAAGEALAQYLTQARPRLDSTAVFITMCAPYGPISPHVVRHAMYRACDRAGLPQLGPHRLRHALACEVLRAGGSLAEVGQLLRHRGMATTLVYANSR